MKEEGNISPVCRVSILSRRHLVERIIIINSKNQVLQDFEGPSPSSDFIDTSDESTVKKLLKQRFLDVFEVRVNLSDIHIISYDELSKIMFKRTNK
jgi:hypothetical protein